MCEKLLTENMFPPDYHISIGIMVAGIGVESELVIAIIGADIKLVIGINVVGNNTV